MVLPCGCYGLQEKLYETKKQDKPQQQAAGGDADGTTAAAAAAAGGDDASSQQQQQREASPFGCISATMGWETFHLTQTTFLQQVGCYQACCYLLPCVSS
jgi:hypothetical protein